MVKMEDAVIARYAREGNKFEILVDPDLAMNLKKGLPVNMNEMFAIDTIFKDAKKGEDASEETIKKVFGTTELKEVATKIILNGEVQLTTEQRRRMVEQRRNEIIAMIARDAINPQTKMPHPPKRIEIAMENARVVIDPAKPASEQLPGILKEIKKLLPISVERLKIAVRVPALYAGKASPMLHKYDIKQEEWQNDGSLIVVVEIPAGMKNDLFNEINHLTHGASETKMLEDK